MEAQVTIDDFKKLDIRVGKIISAEDFPQARKPTYKLKIDFGPEIGVKKSCAQITVNYSKEQLLGRLVLGVVNFPPRQMGPEVSETLTLGVDGENGVVLIQPERNVEVGKKLY
ncbi:tRNA-binding protein [Candidatus Micrarchaeota archaeon]|nr:tRNA-binding protein [Candidatus Micrarchaeota archaeon]